jgi:hypothetical protein
MRKKEKRLQDLSVKERKALATHYIENIIQPSHYVTLGYLYNDGKFDSLLLTMHKQEAIRKKLIKSNDPLRLMWWFEYPKRK